ncbi:porin [uncultured Tateyamaria sp.]|uniref:porin n=1 Tax=uncultured Tateyamaria sp. TaxID=455651 RepID=UPI002609B525|nr:porin [uncultured Tateyamaria sp.]
MKKFLIASTALVATAGVAAANGITFDGEARFGLGYNESNVAGADETRIEQRFRFNIRGTATSDNGIEFSARIRLEANENADSSIDGRGPGAAEFSVETGGFRLDVGNTSDVADSGDVINYYGAGIGLTAFLEQNSAFYDAGDVAGTGLGQTLPIGGFGAGFADATTIKLRYAVNDFTVAVSYSEDNVNDLDEFQIGAGYNFGNYSAGIVFGDEDGPTGVGEFVIASFSGDLGAFGFSIVVGDADSFSDVAYGASVTYDVGAATELRFVVSGGGADVVDVSDDTAYGLGFRHSLGGGVSLRGGIGSNTAGLTQADLGVFFSF